MIDFPAQRPTYYAYDGRGLLTSATDAFGHAMTYTYDALGRLQQTTDRHQSDPYSLAYVYDAGGRLTDIHGATSFSEIGVHYGYDNADRVNAITDPAGRQTTYSYNNLDQLLTETRPADAQGPRTFTYTYDAFDRLGTATDARQQPVVYEYDLLDRVKKVTHPGGEDNFGYDVVGRLDWYSDATGLTDYLYDDASRVQAITSAQGTVAYSYNDAGQRQSMTLPGARTITYGYDNRAQLQSMTDWLGRANTFAYDDDGKLLAINRYNGVNSTYGYDNGGRLDTLSHNGPGGNLAWFDYTLDEMGNRTGVASHQGTENYHLDRLKRLTAATYATGGDDSYSYHPNGDRAAAKNATETYLYNAAGQLEQVNAPLQTDSYSFTYDKNGNTLTMTDGANQSDSYTWDWANRLTSATVGGQTVSYAYDALGIRVSATISGVQQSYLWDRAQGAPAELPLLIDDGAQSYLHGPGPLAQIDPSGARYDLLTDGLGSVRTLVDGAGAAVGSADYSVFGVYRNQSGVTSRFGFTGEYYAQETGMWHLRARDLHPSLGRFLSADPVQPNAPGTQGYNLYAYVANNPTSWVDPSGYATAPAERGDPAVLAMLYAMRGGLHSILQCALDERCRLAQQLRGELGSWGANLVDWTVESLEGIFFSTYPHQPTPVDPALLVLSVGLSNTPFFGDLYDLYTGVTGYDPITGQYLAGWERLVTLIGVLPILGVAGANMRHTDATIDLVGFRGIDFKMDGGKYANEAPLIVAGHVGISFNGGKTIYGFHPATKATSGLSGAEIINHLRGGGSFVGQVYDDTPIFARAYELGQQGALSRGADGVQLPMTVYRWRQRLPSAHARQIRDSILRQVGDPSLTSSRYSFPNLGPSGYYMPAGCNNCATWPSVEGIQIPETTGRLSEYIEALIKIGGGALWRP